MKIPIFVILVAAIALFFTNPKKDAHIEFLKKEMKEEGAKDGILGGLLGEVAGGLLGAMENSFEWENYYVASALKADDEIWTIGVAGQVIKIRDDNPKK